MADTLMFKYQAITKLFFGELKMEIKDNTALFTLGSDWVHVQMNAFRKDIGKIGDDAARRLIPREYGTPHSNDGVYVIARAVMEMIDEFKESGEYDVWLVQSL